MPAPGTAWASVGSEQAILRAGLVSLRAELASHCEASQPARSAGRVVSAEACPRRRDRPAQPWRCPGTIVAATLAGAWRSGAGRGGWRPGFAHRGRSARQTRSPRRTGGSGSAAASPCSDVARSRRTCRCRHRDRPAQTAPARLTLRVRAVGRPAEEPGRWRRVRPARSLAAAPERWVSREAPERWVSREAPERWWPRAWPGSVRRRRARRASSSRR